MCFNCKKLLPAAILITIVGFVLSWLTCGYLFNWVYLLEPVSVWKVVEMNTAFFVKSLVGTFILSAILVGVYDYIRKGIPLKGIQKGLCFGTMVWLVGVLPGMWSLYMFANFAPTVIVYWLVQGLVRYLILGGIIAWMYEVRK